MASLRLSKCRIWSGYIRPDGYGTLRVAGEKVPRYAHRHVWEQANGTIAPGMELHHLCGVESCVNLDHLALLSRHEHASHHFSQPRTPRETCPNGHPYTAENTGIRSDGFRFCRDCKRANWRRANRKRAAA
jgi:hypothetical protein